MAFRIVALILIAVLLLFPAARTLRFFWREKRSADPKVKERLRQMVEQFVVLVLALALLAVAVMLHFAPF